MKFEIEYIEKLAKIITDNELTEISLEDGEQAVTIRKDIPDIVSAPVVQPVNTVSSSPVSDFSSDEQPENKGRAIVSPMVGTFYSKPSPEDEPFVKVGDTVSAGDVVCIIEAMKMMNQIESEFSGKIVEICVADGEPVEFGQIIMYVE